MPLLFGIPSLWASRSLRANDTVYLRAATLVDEARRVRQPVDGSGRVQDEHVLELAGLRFAGRGHLAFGSGELTRPADERELRCRRRHPEPITRGLDVQKLRDRRGQRRGRR